VTGVLYFEVSDDTMKVRLLKRGETSGRVDDNEETIAKRLKTFHNHTQPVIDHYAKQNKVKQVRKILAVIFAVILSEGKYFEMALLCTRSHSEACMPSF